METYDYTSAGFDKFFNRSVEDTSQVNLDSPSAPSMMQRFDDLHTSGAMGNTFRIGNIYLNGVDGRISIFDENGNEVLRIGELDG